MELDEIFSTYKLTENGDIAYSSTGSEHIDILFGTEYFRNHCGELPSLVPSSFNLLFSMLLRDPRYGFGQRNIGRSLLKDQGAFFSAVLRCGRADDLWKIWWDDDKVFPDLALFLRHEIESGNELVKKWMPRYGSKDGKIAQKFAHHWGMGKREYSKFIKCVTVESMMSVKDFDSIRFDHVPSLAFLKYSSSWKNRMETAERYADFMINVREGRSSVHTSVTTPYDLYKAALKSPDLDIDTLFSQLPKISGSWIPIVDTSGSMFDKNDSIGKALSVGHYLAKTSTFAPGRVISFSYHPELIRFSEACKVTNNESSRITELKYIRSNMLSDLSAEFNPSDYDSNRYFWELTHMLTGDWTNTNFGAVCELLKKMGPNVPDYIIVLSDMEFDAGSSNSKEEMMKILKEYGDVRLIWWNFNSRAITAPELDSAGNIFLSGYNPLVLSFLEVGFNPSELVKLLVENYRKKLEASKTLYM